MTKASEKGTVALLAGSLKIIMAQRSAFIKWGRR